MSYLDWNWNGTLKYEASFLKNPHISEIVVECAERQLIQDIYNIPAKRPVLFIPMCGYHGIATDIARHVAPLQRDVYRLFQYNCEEAFDIVEHVLRQVDDSPYYQSYQSSYQKMMERTPAYYRNQARELFNQDVYYDPGNRNYLHDMASVIEKIEYAQIKAIPANGRRGPSFL